MAHTFMALRAGGVVYPDDSSQVSSAADRGQSASTLVAADPVQAPATGGGTVTNFVQASASALLQPLSVPAVSQAVSVPGVVTDLHVPLELRGGGTVFSSESSGDSFTPLSLGELHFLGNGWFIVPSVANETGSGYAARGDGDAWILAGGDFTSDWFFV